VIRVKAALSLSPAARLRGLFMWEMKKALTMNGSALTFSASRSGHNIKLVMTWGNRSDE
jgi:hypothetical protein